MQDLITHPCPNLIGGLTNYMALFYMDVITHSRPNPDASLRNISYWLEPIVGRKSGSRNAMTFTGKELLRQKCLTKLISFCCFVYRLHNGWHIAFMSSREDENFGWWADGYRIVTNIVEVIITRTLFE